MASTSYAANYSLEPKKNLEVCNTDMMMKKDKIYRLSSINGGDILPYRPQNNIRNGRRY